MPKGIGSARKYTIGLRFAFRSKCRNRANRHAGRSQVFHEFSIG
jgi:hypothetical protein